MRTRLTLLGAVTLALSTTSAIAAVPPVAVSPGSARAFLPIDSRCPTFTWSRAAEDGGYELTVYRLDEERDPATLETRVELPAGTGSWTASGTDCLERAGRYAWSVRALAADGPASEWAEPKLFRWPESTPVPDLEHALRTLERYHAATRDQRTKHDRDVATEPASPVPPAGAAGDGSTAPGASPRREHAAAVTGVQISGSSIRISGDEVVTTATDQDTLGELSCAEGELVVRTSVGWGCLPPAPASECEPSEVRPCYPADLTTLNVGECRAGVQSCNSSGTWDLCVGAVTPSPEVCDSFDNDCNGQVDDVTVDDPLNCGACGLLCEAEPATCVAPGLCQGVRGEPVCSGGSCSTIAVDDDSACDSSVVADNCGLFVSVVCTGAADQPGPPPCATSCFSDDDCDSIAYCESSACLAKKSSGDPCSTDNECLSGSCTGTCQ